MSDNQDLNLIIKKKQIPNLSQWSVENKNALLKMAASRHKAQFIYDLVKNNSQYISIEQLEALIFQSIGLSNCTIIIKLITVVSPEYKVRLIKSAIEQMLALDLADMLYRVVTAFPYFFSKPDQLCSSSLPEIFGTFCFKKHILGLKFILTKPISDEDINFYCRRAAKDNEPDVVAIFISNCAAKLEPMTKGVMLLNLAHFGQEPMLLLFFNKIKFTNKDYIERALVKAVRHGHVASVECILSQSIEWDEDMLERAIDKALTYKEDDCLFKIFELKYSLLLPKTVQNLLLDAYANGCVKIVGLLLNSHLDKIWNKTKGELLLLATKKGDSELVKKLIPLVKKSKMKPPYKKQAYFIALKENNGLDLSFEQAYSGIEGIIKKDELTEDSQIAYAVNQTLTFQFSRLRISKKELVEECNQTKMPTKRPVYH